jgi:hypothetical protein
MQRRPHARGRRCVIPDPCSGCAPDGRPRPLLRNHPGTTCRAVIIAAQGTDTRGCRITLVRRTGAAHTPLGVRSAHTERRLRAPATTVSSICQRWLTMAWRQYRPAECRGCAVVEAASDWTNARYGVNETGPTRAPSTLDCLVDAYAARFSRRRTTSGDQVAARRGTNPRSRSAEAIARSDRRRSRPRERPPAYPS